MSNAQLIDAWTNAINHHIDFPLLSESTEGNLIRPVVEAIVPHIPESMRPFLNDAADGIDDAERAEYEPVLCKAVADYVILTLPVPLRVWTGWVVQQAVGPVVAKLFDIAQGKIRLGDE